VRCCADERISDSWKKIDGCSVWGESNGGFPCAHEKTFVEASSICELAGARLCSAAELAAGCTEGTGCGHDRDLVWSSDEEPSSASPSAPPSASSSPPPPSPSPPPLSPLGVCVDDPNCPHLNDGDCDDGGPGSDYDICDFGGDCSDCGTRAPVEMRWVECGRTGRCSNNEPSRWADSSETHEVRCCSDSPIDGWTKRGDSCPWAESDRGMDGCHSDKTFAEAEAVCEAAGARLCTKEELEGNCTRGTGCSHDRRLIWSSTVQL